MSEVNLNQLALYEPNSSCSPEDRLKLTMQTAERVFPSLADFISESKLEIASEDFCQTNADESRAETLANLFNHYGSDKSSHHNYHFIYSRALSNPENVTGILEIGLGTNNVNIVSNMGSAGKPGASVRAFRDFCINAQIYGADVDRGILFQEDRISTEFVDQTRSSTVKDLFESKPELDLIIDDGLHSPDANITVLKYALTKLKIGGMLVIEDIAINTKPFWVVVDKLIPEGFEGQLVKTRNNYVYTVTRII